MRMRVYIVNADHYHKGEMVGAWFTPPITLEEIKEKVGLTSEKEEYIIYHCEAPIPIDDDMTLEKLNALALKLEKIEHTPIYSVLDAIIEKWFQNLDEAIANLDHIQFYKGCHSLEDVAKEFVKNGMYGDIPEAFHMYMNYAMIAKDLEELGNFLVTSKGVFEYTNAL